MNDIDFHDLHFVTFESFMNSAGVEMQYEDDGDAKWIDLYAFSDEN